WSEVKHRQWEIRCMEVYAAMVERMDQGIGRIIDTLEKNGQLDNTVILYLQDNGACAEDMGRTFNSAWQLTDIEPLKPHDIITRDKPPMQTREGLPVLGGPEVMPGPGTSFIAYGKAWANVSNTPFRMYKHWIQEGGIATPLIVHWPDGIEQNSSGRLRCQTGQLPDIMATCLEITQVSYPAIYNGNTIIPCQGVSLVKALNNDDPLDREALYWEHEGNRGIRIGDYKLVSGEMPKPRHYEKVELLPLEKWQLFNIAQDRCELNDLASDNPELVREMAAKWQKWAQSSRVVPKPYSLK
ncbi:MAG: sulfatase-like hydrolase/transferase, partial [Sedimentisphaerales bacterium]|nr:sulfatase-like hydrolase/transferase [Sedimentisphaerales bacterium]